MAHFFKIKPAYLLFLMLCALGIRAQHSDAATINVDDPGDVNSSSSCTLRDAVLAMQDKSLAAIPGCQNTGAGFGINDEITFSVPTVGLTGQILFTPQNQEKLLINGGTDGTFIVNFATGVFRLFNLSGAALIGSDNFSLELNKITLAGGNVNGNGGAIQVGDSIRLLVKNSTLINNSATAEGGGIYAAAGSFLAIVRSTLMKNNANRGGAVAVNSFRFNILDSTISANTATSQGGGFYFATTALSNVSIYIRDSTLSGNAANTGGGVYSRSRITIENSIIANSPSGLNCILDGGRVSGDLSHSIIVNGNCGADALKVDPMLGPLTDNGGPTLTHALLAQSPAIDAGNTDCSRLITQSTDQRGKHRPAGRGCDIGAYEWIPETSIFSIPLPNGKSVTFVL